MAGLIPFSRRGSRLINSSFDEFYNMLDDFFTDSFFTSRNIIRDTFRVDIQEKEGEYIIEADLPGIEKDEISLELNDGRLNILVKTEEAIENQDKNYIHKERSCTSMHRSIYLPDALNDGAKARLKNGVLVINMPKQEKLTIGKQIEIE